MSTTRFLVLSVCALLSVGCSGIGDGSKIESIRIVQSATQPDVVATDVEAFTCVRSSLTLVGEFTRGDLGNFSSRAKWTSSKPDVLRVTNFNEPVGDGTGEIFLIGGVLLPQTVDSVEVVTISAEYLGLHAEVDVTVNPVESARFVPAIASIVPGSTLQYAVRATFDGVETDITALTTLSFVQENDEVAFLDPSVAGLVVGVAADPAPMRLKADPGVPCPALEGLEAPLTVAEPDATDPLQLAFEKGFDGGEIVDGIKTGELAEGTSQFLRLYARFQPKAEDEDFSDASRFQALGQQLRSGFGYDVDRDGICELREEGAAPEGATAPVIFNNGFVSGLVGLGLMTATIDSDDDADEIGGNETTLICADFGGTDATDDQVAENGYRSNPLSLTVVDVPLTGLTLGASDPCDPTLGLCVPLDDQRDLTVPRVTGGDLLRIDALGTFEGGYTQKVNTNVGFASSTPLLASVVTGVSSNAGVVATATDLDSVEGCENLASCTATITVTWTKNTADTADDTVETIELIVERADGDAYPDP